MGPGSAVFKWGQAGLQGRGGGEPGVCILAGYSRAVLQGCSMGWGRALQRRFLGSLQVEVSY